jgi:hypothetical protein
LIKDYKQEVHYHPRKANIVADALSHKAHCNYLPVAHLIGEESSTRVMPNLSLFNIILAPTLRDEIIASQKGDEDMSHIKQRMKEGDPKVTCFRGMQKGLYGLRKDWLCRRNKLSRRRLWTKPIHRGTPFILGALRCIMT